MTPEEWKHHYGVQVPIVVRDDGTPRCASDGCWGCAECRAVAKGAPTIPESEDQARTEHATLAILIGRYPEVAKKLVRTLK